jgi:hypothetical protein
LIGYLQHIFERHLKHIGENSPAARFGNRPCGEFVGGRIDVVDFHPGKAFFKYR